VGFLPGIVGSVYPTNERNIDRNRLAIAMPILLKRAGAGPDSTRRWSPRNACVTSGFPRTMIAQIPNGSPSSQLGEIAQIPHGSPSSQLGEQGMVARMAAAPAHG